MVEPIVLSKEVQARMHQLESATKHLQEFFGDVLLNQDDLDAIEEGRRDLKLGHTRRL